jgi:hypothetical protein
MMRWWERISVNAADLRAPAADLAFKPGEDICCGQLRPPPLQAVGHPVYGIKDSLQQRLWGIDECFLTHLGQVEIEQQPGEVLGKRCADPTNTHAVAALKNLLDRLHLTPEQRFRNSSLLARLQQPIAYQIIELEL